MMEAHSELETKTVSHDTDSMTEPQNTEPAVALTDDQDPALNWSALSERIPQVAIEPVREFAPETTFPKKAPKTLEEGNYRRFFLPLPAQIDQFPYRAIIENPDTVNHIRTVLRLKIGDPIVVVDGVRELSYRAEITSMDRATVTVHVHTVYERPRKTTLPFVAMGAALIKGQRWDTLVQKVTELGVRGIVPLQADRSVVQVGTADKKQERWQAIAQSASEQCEGLFVPAVETPHTVAAFCDLTRNYPLKLLMMERDFDNIVIPRRSLRRILRDIPHVRAVAVAIGPEGGWTRGEIEMMLGKGFKPASLGDRVLRSETAAASVMSALAYEFDAL